MSVLHSHHECMRVSMAPQPHQHLALAVLFILAILVEVKGCLIVTICISPMTNNIDHLFLYLLSVSSFVKCLKFKSFLHWGGDVFVL